MISLKTIRICLIYGLMIGLVLIDKSISAQNQAPRFEPSLQSNYFFKEFNSTKPGDILLWLNATDYDDDDLQFGIEGDFYNKLVQLKKVDGKHAVIVDNQIFDREVQEKYENIVFYVKDRPGNKVYQSVRFVILDIDDNPPLFKNTPYKIDVSENTSSGSIIYDMIRACDIDGPLNNRFTFSLLKKQPLRHSDNNNNNNNNNVENADDDEANLFEIDKTNYVSSGEYTSRLILRSKLDYEKSKSHLITISANGENSPFSTTTEMTINVIDYPDRPPEFSQSPYYVKIEEEMPLDAFVLEIFAKDGDYGINNPCQYKIIYDNNRAAEYFKIDAKTGILTIRKRIDLESDEISKLGGLLEFYVIANEVGDESSSERVQVTVAIIDLNDNRPSFDLNVYNLTISPKATPGTSLTLLNNIDDSIHAFDLDKGINGSFSIFLLKLTETTRSVEQSTQHLPLYDNFTDFEIVPKIALNDANLIVKLKSTANLIKKMGSVEHYHLFAKDNGINGQLSHTSLFIYVEIIDQYAPQFDSDLYVFHIDENAKFNTTVSYINAFDNDTLKDYGKVVYELKNGQERFQIDKSSGRIYTISKNPTIQLDRELIDTFYLSVDAIDGGGLRTTAQIIIKLNDLNDNAPQFLNNVFSLTCLCDNKTISNILVGYIEEENSAKWLEPIRLQTVDRDIGRNGEVVYEIIDGDLFADYFQIDAINSLIVLKPNRTLDFEQILKFHKRKDFSFIVPPKLPDFSLTNLIVNPGEIDITLVVSAKDLGEPSLSTKIIVKVIVKDVNDHKPKFEKKFYSTKILETEKSGDIIQVSAIDLDAPNTLNSKVSYRIESGGKDKFYIDSNTGMVRITDNSQLDRDLYGSVYILKIVANDFGSVSDKPAEIGNNTRGSVSTSMMSSSTASSSPSPFFGNFLNIPDNVCYLRIEIIDVNNKKPEFVNNFDVSINVLEDVPIGTQIVQLKATDADTNSKLVYFIVKNSQADNQNTSITNEIFEAFDENQRSINLDLVKNWFDINTENGTIFTKTNLDRETAEQINLIVGVEDLNAATNFKPQIRTATLRIKLIDVNDNYPIFADYIQINPDYMPNYEEPIFELYESVEENSKLNTKIVQLKATDADKDPNITYKVVHSTEKSQLLSLNPLTGDIYVNGQIDHERIEWINLTILAFDNGRPRQKHSILLFSCRIEDLNDNAPKFIQINRTEFSLYEDAPLNTIVSQFNAIDSDSRQYGQVVYQILSGDERKFAIDPNKGILYVNSLLDREEQDLYTLVIQAKDNPNGSLAQQLTDSLLIKIRLLDINDNSPYCEHEFYSAETSQNSEINSTILQVKGFDKDIGKNAQLTYSLSFINETKSQNLFRINPNTGQIQTNRKLYGYSGVYLFEIVIKDGGHSPIPNSDGAGLSDRVEKSRSVHCPLKIFIKDYNAHPPKFIYPNDNNSSIRLRASLPLGSYLLTVNATDPDSGDNGEVLYYLDEQKRKTNDWKSFNLDQKSGVLTTNAKFDLTKQCVYVIEIIVSDMGKPAPLYSRMTLTIILVDDADNAAQFNRMQICLSGTYQCETDYESVIIKLKEEKEPTFNSVLVHLAKMNDVTKNDDDVCYYLSGLDKDHFKLNPTTALLKPNSILNREQKAKYEIVIVATEYCYCIDSNLNSTSLGPSSSSSSGSSSSSASLKLTDNHCGFLFKEFDRNDASQLKLKIYVEDINDNTPHFSKELYQVGITSDVEFGETILESFAFDSDASSNLNFSLVPSTFMNNLESDEINYLTKESSVGIGSGGDASGISGGVNSMVSSPSIENPKILYFPFNLIFFDSKLIKPNLDDTNDYTNAYRKAKFQLKTQKYFREQDFSSGVKQSTARNRFFQFNISVSDQFGLNATSVVQIVLINKQQRVKLVFSQSYEKVLAFQDEFQAYISNLTGFRANIDKINVHRGEDDEDVVDTETGQQLPLTDMMLHFIRSDAKLYEIVDMSNETNMSRFVQRDDYIVNADTILNILDRSKDSNLLRKYKLSLAEKYDDQGTSTFYKYGSAVDDDFRNVFLWLLGSKTWSSFLTRLILSIICVVLLFVSIIIIIVCCCMRKKFKRKIKAERALVKAFGLEQRSLTYNDAISGYVNSAFDSNSLLPIPGTNLYAYEGSNPMWLKKYDKIDIKNQPSSGSSASSSSSSASSSSSTSNQTSESTCDATKTPRDIQLIKSDDTDKIIRSNDEISSFYLKQIDSTPATSRCSPITTGSSHNHMTIDKIKIQNITLTSEILSIKDISPQLILAAESNDNLISTSSASSSSNSSNNQKSNSTNYNSHTNSNNNNNNNNNSNQTSNSFSVDTLLTFASGSNQSVLSNSNSTNKQHQHHQQHQQQQQQQAATNEFIMKSQLKSKNNKLPVPHSLLYPTSSNNYTKIYDTSNYQQQHDFILLNNNNNSTSNCNTNNGGGGGSHQSTSSTKDYCDLFAVESTVI